MSGANPRTIEAAVPLLLVSLPIDDPIAGTRCPPVRPTRSSATAARPTDKVRYALGRMMSAKLRANCPYTPRDLAGHYDPNGQLHACAKCDGRHGPSTDYYPHKSHRRQLCATVPIITGTAKASAARSVTDDLVSSVTTSAAPPSAQGNAPIASRSVGMRTADGCAGLKRPDDWDALHPGNRAE